MYFLDKGYIHDVFARLDDGFKGFKAHEARDRV